MAEDGHLLHDWTSRTPSLLDGRIVLSGRVDGTVVMFVMNDDFERTRDELFQGDQVTSSCGKVYRLGVPQAPAEQPPDVEIRQRDLAAYAAEAADRLGRRADPAEPTITITSAQSLPVATVVDDEALGTGIDAGAGADPPRELGGALRRGSRSRRTNTCRTTTLQISWTSSQISTLGSVNSTLGS